MKNLKLERNLVGPSVWANFGVVSVSGDPDATELPPDTTLDEKERIIQSWQKVAVLRVEPDVPVRLGFLAAEHGEYLREILETQDGRFGVHIGPKDTTFLVWAEDLQPVNLTLEEVTSIDDPAYSDLPLY